MSQTPNSTADPTSKANANEQFRTLMSRGSSLSGNERNCCFLNLGARPGEAPKFANISAGHIIILSLISLIFMAQSGLGNGGAFGVAPVSVIFVLFMYLIEVLVAFLQAYIFTLLSAVFIGLAVKEEDH